MRISYKTLQKYIINLPTPEEVARLLVMHVADVEEIIHEWEWLEHVFVWEVIECEQHSNSDRLKCAKVKINWKTHAIVCGAPNLEKWQRVPVILPGGILPNGVIIKKTEIRGESSEWMICAEDEIGLTSEKKKGIMVLSQKAILWTSMKEYLWMDDVILVIDNKAINHRPDLFSHIWIIRELCVLLWQKMPIDYLNEDFSSYPKLKIENEVPDDVHRYIWLEISWVSNKKSPEDILEVISAWGAPSLWILVDISNYSLYFYGQPIHVFDAEKIDWNIVIRYAKKWESFVALDDKEYSLTHEDIVIADKSKVLALGWIIWWKSSCVTEETQRVIIEAAHFDQAILRKSWRKLWIRTDALNIFEKAPPKSFPLCGISLVCARLREIFEYMKIISYNDVYSHKQDQITIPYSVEFTNQLIGASYEEKYVLWVLDGLGISKKWEDLEVPFWRTDMNYKADIAEDVARIHGYDQVKPTIPRVNLWAVLQDVSYSLRLKARKFLTDRWYFDLYSYSFVNEKLMSKVGWDINDCIPMKNCLSEDLTHLKPSLIPHILAWLETNSKEYNELKLFELEKVFRRNLNDVNEYYSLAWLFISPKEVAYYESQSLVSDLLKTINIDKFSFETPNEVPSYIHKWRSAAIVVRWKEVGFVWEIHPKVWREFGISDRIGLFEINVDKILDAAVSIREYKEISIYQENNFDLSFVVDKKTEWKKVQTLIAATDKNIINKVELFDIYEDEDKLPWKRSLTFKIFIQSMDGTLDDSVKAKLISGIIEKVKKTGGVLRA